MKCKECKESIIFWGGNYYFTVICRKYNRRADTTHPETRPCIEDDYDVLWRAGAEMGERRDGRSD